LSSLIQLFSFFRYHCILFRSASSGSTSEASEVTLSTLCAPEKGTSEKQPESLQAPLSIAHLSLMVKKNQVDEKEQAHQKKICAMITTDSPERP
jgi:hypothetical protein